MTTRVLRSYGSLLAAIGAGVLLGGGLVLLMRRWEVSVLHDIEELVRHLNLLRREVRLLRRSLDGRTSNSTVDRQGQSLAKSEPANSSSSSEDDELFQEALEVNVNDHLAPSANAAEFYSAVSLTSLAPLSADDFVTRQLYAEIDKLFTGTDCDMEAAFKRLQAEAATLSHDPSFLWRMSKSCYQMSTIEGAREQPERKKTLLFKAKTHAFRALELDDTNFSVFKWCAITVGSLGDYEGPQERIENGFKFKEFIEKAICLNPADSSSQHLLGRWCYGVYMLSWWERQAAAALFSSPPTSTVDEALAQFLEADRLTTAKPWKENLLYIGKCYIEKRDYATAVDWLDNAGSVPSVSGDDKTAQEEIEKLLQTYSRYRL